MSAPVKWAAELTHVREVSLMGAADLAFWRERLLKEDLIPAERDGQARLLIIAADSNYKGIRFGELSFSVLVSRLEKGTRQDAAYLVRAFNSNRVFAFIERGCFSTPYEHGEVRVSCSWPISIHLMNRGEVVFRAEMGADGSGAGREVSCRGEDGWEGPVFLPESRRGRSRRRKLFFARLRGDTRTYPFVPSLDWVSILPTPDREVLQALRDSQFVGKEWIVREDATHAKSKTYKQPDASTG